MIDESDLADLCLNPDDIARVAEFFECDADAAFDFARRIWLPEANRTAVNIMNAIRLRDWTALIFLCDHLREGARWVGASRIIYYAGEIERAATTQFWLGLPGKAQKLKAALDTLGALLTDCVAASPPHVAYYFTRTD